MEALTSRIEKLNLGPWLEAGLIVIAFLILGKVVELIFTRALSRMTQKTRTDIDDEAIRILHRPVFLSVLFFGLAAAFHRLGVVTDAERTVLSLLKTILVLVWMAAGFGLANVFFSPSATASGRVRFLDARTVPLFNNLAKIAAVAAAVYFVFVVWHIDPTAWLASAGIVGIAVGFAAKDTLANLFAGVFILVDAPYKVGDYINLDTGERGEVTHIGLRSTRILTRDDIEITVPNSVIGTAKIVNETGGRWPRERIRTPVGVAYGSDVDQVRRVLLEAGKATETVCEDPEPIARFRGFGESSLDFELLCWIQEPVLRGRTLDELNTAIYKALAREGIEIPFPKRDVYIKSMPGVPPAPPPSPAD